MIQKDYIQTVRKFTGCYNGGTTTIWSITAPSGNKYNIFKNSKRAWFGMEDEHGFKFLDRKESYQEALTQIYDWENSGTSPLPDLTNKEDLKEILNEDCGIFYAGILAEENYICSTLPTAVYLFESHFYTFENTTRNATNLNDIFRSLSLSEKDQISLCQYAISKDPNCSASIPCDLLTKLTKEGKANILFQTYKEEIPTDWFENPTYGEKVKDKYLENKIQDMNGQDFDEDQELQ